MQQNTQLENNYTTLKEFTSTCSLVFEHNIPVITLQLGQTVETILEQPKTGTKLSSFSMVTM